MRRLFRIDIDNGLESPAEHCYCTQLVIASDAEQAVEKAKICPNCGSYGSQPSISATAIEKMGRYRVVVVEQAKKELKKDEIYNQKKFLEIAKRTIRKA